MLIKILGIMDILTAIFFWIFGMFHLLPTTLVLAFSIYLLAKGILFVISDHIASVLDIICALVILLSLQFNLPRVIVFLVAILILQKGILSLFS